MMIELEVFFQFLFSGLTTGCIYAICALGFVLNYNVSNVLNFAQGEYVAYGGLVAASLVAVGVPMPLAVLAAIAVGTLIGIIQERLTLAPVRSAPGFIIITITLGVSAALRGLAMIIFGKDPLAMRPFTGSEYDTFHLMLAVLPWQTIWVWGLTILSVGLAFWFLKYTQQGRAVRAVSTNLLAANLMGINAARISSMVYGASAGIGALGGAIIAPIVLANWFSGLDFALKGFMGAIIGNLRNPGRAVLGGLGVGVLEQFAAGYISSGTRNIVVFGALILFLMVQGGVFARGREDLIAHGGH
ncbi:MAG: branched-chain amino acid ABC transporter permease [Deltaproteobacteria bacterium]|nr:branched-chain amino acid ABC transporter permease [Deltaproteobacteria bacterium]